jgi:predicted nucleic acid-binding Zn finger protein
VAESILADNRHTTREEIKQAIQQRTTRGMLTYNTGRVHEIDDGLWAVPSTRGGFYQVNLVEESCPCEDFTFYCSERGLACRHVVAAAIAREKRRLWLRRAAREIAPIFADVGDAV